MGEECPRTGDDVQTLQRESDPYHKRGAAVLRAANQTAATADTTTSTNKNNNSSRGIQGESRRENGTLSTQPGMDWGIWVDN